MALPESPAAEHVAARSPTVFISYRRQEASYLAGWLHDTLTSALGPERVFLDIDSIRPGAPFPLAVDRAIDDLTVVLVLIGPHWASSGPGPGRRLDDEDDPVRLEIETAFRRGARVLPVLLEDTPMPAEGDLPASVRELTRINALRLRYDTARRDIAQLVDVLGHLMDPGEEPGAPRRVAVGEPPSGDGVLAAAGSPPSPVADPDGQRTQLLRLQRACLGFYRTFEDRALHGGAVTRIPLDLEVSRALVGRPGDRLLPAHLRRADSQVTDRSLLQVFDDLGGPDGDGLLLLGGPGAGKTLELVQLARLLTERRLADETLPLPMYLPLAGWATRRRPLPAWVVEQLDELYLVPPDLSRHWITDGRLLLLLDGLDEIPERASRTACVEEVNRFLRFGRPRRSALVVSSRPAEYELLDVRLNLEAAVSIRPLEPDQVVVHLARDRGGDEPVEQFLREQPHLRDVLRSPLLLSMVTLGDVPALRSADPAVAARRLVESYVDRRLGEEAAPRRGDRARNTRRWLSWLARHLDEDRRTVFLVTHIPSHWATYRHARRLMICGPLAVHGALSGLVFALALTIGGLGGAAGQSPASTGVSILVLSLVVGLVSDWRLRARVCVWVLFGLAMAWLSGAQDSGLPWVVVIGLYLALLYGLIGEVAHRLLGHELPLMEHIAWSWSRARSAMPGALAAGMVFGLAFDMSNWLLSDQALLDALVTGVVFGAVLGVYVGLTLGLTPGLRSTPIPVHVSPYDGLRRSARYGLRVGLVVTPVVATTFWLSGLLLSPSLALLRGLAWGVSAGVLWGLASGLGAVVQYACLRATLSVSDALPLRLVTSLDRAVGLRILYRGPGGGYLFIHGVVQDYFGARTSGPAGTGPHPSPVS